MHHLVAAVVEAITITNPLSCQTSSLNNQSPRQTREPTQIQRVQDVAAEWTKLLQRLVSAANETAINSGSVKILKRR